VPGGPYEALADPAFLMATRSLVEHLTASVRKRVGGRKHWIFYGSRVTGTASRNSDVDVIVSHRGEQPPTRVDAAVDGSPVTIYCVSRNDLLADGYERAFGGYFSLKLFSPFVCWPTGPEPALLGAMAGFLAPFAAATAPAGAARSADQILADAYLAFLHLYPDFDGYVASSLRPPVRVSRLWRRQASVLREAFQAAGYICRTDQGSYRYTARSVLADPDRAGAAAAARFWAFGAVCHRADFAFPEQYRRKALGKASAAEREAVRRLLGRISEGTAT
jgi:hypothetical protein